MKWIIFWAMIITLTSLNGQVLQKNILFNLDGISFSEYEDYDIIQIDDGVSCSNPGYPALPSLIYNYCIPQTSKASNISLENQEWISLGYYNIIPQQQGSSSPDDTTFTPENDSVYSLNQFYPESPLITFNNGNMSGFMLTGAVICPFRYNPVTNELQMLLSTQIQIDYELNEEIAISLSPNQYNIFKDMVADLVDNDGDIIGYSPMVRELAEYEGLVEYVVIVNNESFVEYFEPLIRWKKARGIPSEVVTTNWINSTYSGVDIQEKIRHFLQDYHNRFGLIYANFAGTDNGIYRTIPVDYDFTSGSVHYDVPCDMYFSDIVPYYYDWDDDNDLIYGEFWVDNDACDWMGDLLVGRIPVENISQVEDWVQDQIEYELYQNNNHSLNILLVGARLGGIALGSTPCYILWSEIWSLCNVTGLFEENYSYPNYPSVPSYLQNGNIFCYISAHGNIGGTSWYGNIYHPWIPMLGQLLANTPPCFIVTPACNCGWFDNAENCLAEKLNTSEYSNGSRAIGTVMSSRLGAIYPNSTEIGPSDQIAVSISTCLIPKNYIFIRNIGAGFCTGRSNYAWVIEYLFDFGNHHYLVNNFNLLGDPESDIWYIDDLESFSVFHDDYIHLTSQYPYPEYDVEVCKEPTGDGEPDPVEDAIVIISFPEENDNINNWGFYCDTTNQSGWVHMDYELYRSGTTDNIFDVVLTVQKPGVFKPFVDTLKHAYWYSDAGGYIGDLDWANYWDEGGAGGNSYGEYIIQKSTGEHLVLVKNGSIYKLIEANGELDTTTVIDNIDMDSITCFIETYDDKLVVVGGDIFAPGRYSKKIIVYTPDISNNYSLTDTYEYLFSFTPIEDIIETSEDKYVVVGMSDDMTELGWARKFGIGSEGQIGFSKGFVNNFTSVCDSLKTISQRSDGKYVMIGNSFWVVNTDGTIHSHVDYTTDSDPQDVAYIPDRNRFMIVGSTSSGGFIRETDVNGNEINFTEFSSNSHPYIYNINSITKVGLSESFVYCCSGQGWDPCLEESCAVLVTRDIYDIESGSFMFGNPFEVIYNQFWYKSTIANVCANNNGSVTFAGTMYHEDGSSDYAISKFGESKENMNPQNALNFDGQNIEFSFICSNNIIEDQALLRYSLPISSNINISIYNIAGQKVATLENGFKNAGFHEITWNVLDSKGCSISNGCYFVRFTSDNYIETKNITVIR